MALSSAARRVVAFGVMADLHLDCFSGLAGDMFLGACLDLGMPESVISESVRALGLPDVSIETRRAKRGGIAGVRFRVLKNGSPIEGPDPDENDGDSQTDGADRDRSHADARHLKDIQRLIQRSELASAVKERALQLFSRLGEAEARVHGVPVDRVHFHEVGAIDSIVDLVGAAAAIEYLRPGRVSCGPVNVGGGTVDVAHGHLPVPPPAVAQLVLGMPIYSRGKGELLTPTGAVLLTELVDEFESASFVPEGVGYGLGKRELEIGPNAVRLWRGNPIESRGEAVLLECEVDDLSGEGFGFLMERLLESGSLDVFFTPVQMKKNRPGVLVSVLCRRQDLDRLAALLLAESGSFGCRWTVVERIEAQRDTRIVQTRFGEISVKRARLAGKAEVEAPEFEDCRRLARAQDVPWRVVYQAAIAALTE